MSPVVGSWPSKKKQNFSRCLPEAREVLEKPWPVSFIIQNIKDSCPLSREERTGGVVQAAEHQPLSSNPSPTKKEERRSWGRNESCIY
jgi:hypothetical protein